MGITIRSLVLLVTVIFSLNLFAGGEVPWPYTSQMPMTAENSKGIWWVSTEEGLLIYNVEIFDTEVGDSWMRVTELNPWTYEVLNYGEGLFCNKREKNAGRDGRLLNMFTQKEDFEYYPLRLVEVDMENEVVLGVSIYKESESEHSLGYRESAEPLKCYYPSKRANLVCESPSKQEMTQE